MVKNPKDESPETPQDGELSPSAPATPLLDTVRDPKPIGEDGDVDGKGDNFA